VGDFGRVVAGAEVGPEAEVLCGFLLKAGVLREFLKFLEKKRYFLAARWH